MSAPTYDLGRLHGGLRLAAHKSASTTLPIQAMPPPPRLVLPVSQHAGDQARATVAPGERVLRGQVIAEPAGPVGAPLHAPSSGIVVAVEERPVAQHFGASAPCIVIDCDGLDQPISVTGPATDYTTLDPAALRELISDGGIVGLGGAVFPTAQKLTQARTGTLDYLVINGVECEPYISCDDVLMRERARELLGGTRVLLHALEIDAALVVVESDKPAALHSLGEALAELGDSRLVLKQVPTIYPSGGEDQLLQLVTGREVPSGGLPSDVGCVVQNAGTAAAVHDWVVSRRPLISRITTVTGSGVVRPMNVEVRLGTPFADVIDFAGGYTDQAGYLVMGGSMTGKSVSTDCVPVVKATNCILVLSTEPARGAERPCIRCGECAESCPVQLLPQQLHWHARSGDESRLRRYGLTDCIECGCCDLVCPSHIPLTANFRAAKARLREAAHDKARAEHARRRFEARSTRLERDAARRDEELARQKEQARQAGPAAIAEILERRRREED